MQPNTTTTPTLRGIEIVPTTHLPDKQRTLFKFPVFNLIQSKCFPTAYGSDDNLVVSAPTGSGKTVIMELAILRLVDQLSSGKAKAVYQAPTKSLCNERHSDWQKKFGIFGIQCAELTGDTDFLNLRNVSTASIIITTPEKWDSVTRKWKDNSRLMEMIKLFLVDEVHILKDVRGATLEAIVSRMKSVGCNIRFIALSATIPNSDDIATWLTLNEQTRYLPAKREVFDDTFRPVQLKKYVFGHQSTYNPWAFDNTLTQKIHEVVVRYGKKKPVMVFCATKESAQKTANALAQSWFELAEAKRAWNRPSRTVDAEHDQLQKTLPAGVAFHHASLSPADRKAVEQGFLDANINVICSTSTLAVGVNLPCYLVILKGTFGYSDSGLQEYSSLEVMQMLGRAGRPQFETEACAVILCQNERAKKYETMIAGEEILESSLHQNLIEHLNAEISIGTINSRLSAKQWLQSTFLYIRLQKNPDYYDIDPARKFNNSDDALLAWCEKDLDLLQDARLVHDCGHLKCTEFGDAMARYCVKFDTMKTFIAVPTKAKVSDILSTLAQAAEFRDLRMRQGDKTMFKEINKANETRYPIQVDLALPQHKVSLIIQAKLGSIPIERTSKVKITAGQVRQLFVDTNRVIGHCKRLIRCLVDVLVQKQDSFATQSALELTRSIAAGVWDDTVMQLKQIPGIGDVYTRKLAAAGIKSLDALFNTKPHRIELILSKNPPFGLEIAKKVAAFPMLHISAKEADKKRKHYKGVEIKLQCEIGFVNKNPPLYFNKKQFSILHLCETSSGALIDFRRFNPRQLQRSQEFLLTALVKEPASKLRCHIMCDDIAGTHRFVELPIDCPNSWFSPKQSTPPLAFETPTMNIKASAHTDEFEDGGLADSDLLAAVQVPSIEVVEDIDDIMAEVDDGLSGEVTRKRSNTHHSTDGEDHCHEPIQLSNGNFSCRHACNDKGIDCKHLCCKEGSKRKTSTKRRKKDDAHPYSDTAKQESRRKKNTKKGCKPEGTINSLLHRSKPYTKNGEVASKCTTGSRLNTVSSSIVEAESNLRLATKARNGVENILRVDLSDKLCPSELGNPEDYDWQILESLTDSIEGKASKRNTADGRQPEPKQTVLRGGNTNSRVIDSPHAAQPADQSLADKSTLLTDSDSGSPGQGLTERNVTLSAGDDYSMGFDDFDIEFDLDEVKSLNSQLPNPPHIPAGQQHFANASAVKESQDEEEVAQRALSDGGAKDGFLPGETEVERKRRLWIEGQKKCWDDLNDPYLTYENFWFIKVIPDKE